MAQHFIYCNSQISHNITALWKRIAEESQEREIALILKIMVLRAIEKMSYKQNNIRMEGIPFNYMPLVESQQHIGWTQMWNARWFKRWNEWQIQYRQKDGNKKGMKCNSYGTTETEGGHNTGKYQRGIWKQAHQKCVVRAI